MRRRRRYSPDPFALAIPRTRSVIHAATGGVCAKCLTDYPAGTLLRHTAQGWAHAVCDENEAS